MVTILVHFGLFWCIFVHFGAPHVWLHDPSMTCTDSYPLSSVNLMKKRSYKSFRTSSKHFCSVMPKWQFLSILVHFGPFWCILMHLIQAPMTPPHLSRLISPFKCSFNPEKDHISHSGQIWDSLFCHDMVTILVNFGPFCFILVQLMRSPTTPPWLVLTPIPFQVSI